ncbi:MAG: Na/Pi cotransporter family protein [Clostridia bacterium]|nr:Na/Pi cotransporter family protein [Clostridia bacterium]
MNWLGFDMLSLFGGLCLFLFGMNIMGEALERRAGSGLQSILGRLTTGRLAGLLTGLGVTAVIQSSSATTVMVVGFVNSGLMSLSQAINVIMGANIGTTVTAWVLSLTGIEGGAWYVEMFKPMVWTPILAVVGVVCYMFCKSNKRKDTGLILLGFTTLMFGMDIMSGAVSGLQDAAWFKRLFLMFENPVLAMLAGALLTAIIQSSSASVGILQALAGATAGTAAAVNMGAAIPIIMGQNIGTCITALLSSVGANKNARRAALVHLSFNVLGSLVWLTVFCILKAVMGGGKNAFTALIGSDANQVNIAIAHSVFNIGCTLLLLPLSKVLERIAYVLVPEGKKPETEQVEELDERLLATPFVALERARGLTIDMADCAALAVDASLRMLDVLDVKQAECIRAWEDRTDHYEDVLGTYLVRLSAARASDADSAQAAVLLRAIGDFERVADHAASILCAAEEMKDKKIRFTDAASQELSVLREAVMEILGMACKAFADGDMEAAAKVEPLEQIIDRLREELRRRHIARLQQGVCTMEAGFVWADLLTDLSRISDHCSNVAGGVIDLHRHNLNTHEALREARSDSETFRRLFGEYTVKYLHRILPAEG